MKKLLKQLICLVLAGCIAFGGMAFGISELKARAESYSGTCGSSANWSLDSGVLTISGSGSTGAYQAVSGAKSPWFNHREEILHVVIDEGITSVGVGSFQDCSNLLDVSLPESLEIISETSFSGCNKLQSISIPSKVEKIEASAFLECAVLETVEVASENAFYSDDNGILFNKNKTGLVLFPKGKIVTEYSIPTGITEIGEYAFANCSELLKINIPSTVNDIGMCAFQNCRTLLAVNIPEGVTSIKSNTFYGCSALYEVTLPSTITSVGSNSFGKCGSLMKINVPNATKSIDASAFSSSPNLKVYCDKDSYAHEFCISNSIDYCYSNLSSVYPVASWAFGNVPHLGQRYARIDVKCTWYEAKRVCEMLGGHLATVTSAEEMATIKTLLSNGTPYAYWLGASDEKTEGTWEWVTGEEFSYSLWCSGQPDDCGGVEDYLETWGRGESWNDNNLYGSSTEDSRGFVCEFENFYIPSKTTVYNGNTYYLFDELVSWYTAYNVCQNIGGHLATITSAEEQRIITDLCYGSFYTAYWLGATDDSSEGTWKWVTGEPFSYTNWGSGEPNNANSNEHYLEQYYTWNDYIDDGYRGFICEIESSLDLPISSGYYKGNRYEVYNKNLSWVNAQQIAQSKGGHLATITDSNEVEYLHSLYKDLTLADDYLFTGGFRYKYESGYRWVTGEIFSYSNWNDGEPNGYLGYENYAQIYRYSNGWNDIGNKGSYYDGSVFIVEYESPKQIITLSEPDGTVLNRYKVQGGIPVDEPLKDYRPGYTAEWYKDSSLQNKWDFENDVVTEDTVLYAYWVADTYTVDFDANGGECNSESMNVVFGSPYGTLPDCSRDGYSFMGWYSDEACSVKIDENTAVSVSDNHILYAKWQAETYTVTFEGNGGECATESESVVFGNPYGELPLCTKAGSEFIGWHTDDDCTVGINENSIVNTAQDHLLYAGWSESAVTSLKLVSKPTKTEYYVGDTLDTTGLSVRATYENGSSGELSADKMTYSITEFISSGKKIVKASYGGKYVSFIVNVKNRNLTSVSVETKPQKLVYTVGETLDTAGLVLKVVYDDSSTKTVTEGFTATCDLSSAGTKNVAVNYTENGVTVSTSYQITVNPKVTEPDAVISADSVSVTAGETVSVPFRIENNKGFMGFAITVDYDSEAFTPVSVTPGAIIGNGTLNDSIGTAYEYLKIVYVGSDDVSGDGELFTVDFVANENASGNYSFDVSYLQPDTFNESLDNVVFRCDDFDVTVSNSAVEQSVIFIGGAVDADAGTAVTVPVLVENGVGISSFSFRIGFNSEIMSFADASDGAVLVDGRINASVSEAGNEILLNWSGSPISADGVLFYVTFEIDEYVQSDEMLTVSCESINFDNGTVKDVICSDAEVNISNPDGGDNPVIYSKDCLRIEDSVIEIPVYIKNNHGVMGFGMNFEYDSSVITPLSVTAGSLLSAGYFVNNAGTKDGSFKVLWNHTENIYGNGLLFTLKFSVADGAKPESVPLSFAYSQPDTYNEDWEDVALNVNISGIDISYIYTATFMHNGEVIGTDEFFTDDESLDYPSMPEKTGYKWAWDEHEIIAEDITVEGRYIPIEHTISYYVGDSFVATDKFTVETDKDEIVLPEIPEKEGYAGEWEDFELGTNDIRVNCIYTPIVYTATFMHNGEVVGTDEFFFFDESLECPSMPEKAGYEWAWDEYEIVAEDITVEGIYIPIEYTISYYIDGSLVATDKFTVETDKDEIVLPEIPEKEGYAGEWEDFELGTNDIRVNCIYTPIVYTATFMHNGEVVGTDEFTVEDSALDLPEIEPREHYAWEWDKYVISAADLSVEGRYVPIEYTVNFVSGGQTVKTQKYTVETLDSISAPELSLPAKEGYYSEWESWEGKVGNLTVNEIYVAREYTVSFLCDGQIISQGKFTVETKAEEIELPEVPEKTGYTGKWNDVVIAAKDIEVKCVYTPIVYTATFISDGKVIGTDTFTVEDKSLDYPVITKWANYDWVWDEHQIEARDLTVEGRYVPITYTITFVSNGKVVKTQEYNADTLDSIVAPAKSLPAKQHYTTEWEDWKGKHGNITVNEIYVPIEYKMSFYCQGKLVATRIYTIETSLSQIIIPDVPKLEGYTVKWPEVKLEYKNQTINAVCTPIVYLAEFVADGEVVDICTFTVETEKLDEPAVPQKRGYIAAWGSYTIKAQDITVYAKYYSPEVAMRAKATLKTDETLRLLPSGNFEVTGRSWVSSDPDVATVDSYGNVTAVGKGKCDIYVTCYGKDSFGYEIKATNKTEITVKEQNGSDTFQDRFTAAFEDFFQVKLHDILYNFREVMILLFRYAY